MVVSHIKSKAIWNIKSCMVGYGEMGMRTGFGDKEKAKHAVK